MNNLDVIKIHDKKFTLPKRRREILINWYSDEDINNENRIFEQMYNNLPKIDKYEQVQILEKIYIDLDKLPVQVIHGDLGRKNVMYKNDQLIVIDPKITLGRPMEDLAYFILKGGSCKEPNDIIKIINKTLEQLSCEEALELRSWLLIYNISIYVEYIKKINESTKIKMIPRIEKVFDYINQELTEEKVSY